jgi:spore coat protein CotH
MKWIKSITAIILVILILFALNNAYNNSDILIYESDSVVDTVVFPHNEVIDVNIEIDEDVYAEMNANASSEEIVAANITYNGNTFYNIGIRPKGNSSLRDVANSDSDRYSFKIDFNYYVDDQSFYGITKINLNNLYSDPSMMAEYLGYEMLDELDAVSSRTTYVKLSINGEYFGLYLAVEQVNDEFLIENFGNDSGELYKPDLGTGADLAYISDDGMDYTGLFPENKDKYDNEEIVELIKIIDSGGDLDSVFDVDSFLKYLAVSTMTIHQDSYQGSMFHNYYLYNNEGIFEWIAWDLNMIFNGFTASHMTDDQAIQFLIDEPVSGSMESYPLIQAIFENEENIEKYHEYLEILSSGYLDSDNFNEKVLSVYDMINEYVKIDPTAFYTYEEFENGLFGEDSTELGLLSFVEKRVENVAQQLSGEISSTNNGEGNATSSNGGGMKGQAAEGQEAEGRRLGGQIVEGQMAEEQIAEGQRPEGQMAEEQIADGERPERNNQQQTNNDMTEQQTNNDIAETNSKDSLILLGLIGILIALGIYFQRKH